MDPRLALSRLALDAANKSKPRVYRITDLPEGKLRFFTVGCHGSGDKDQRETAALMNHIAQQQKDADEYGPAGIFFLGDNIYPAGTSHPNDPSFKKQHHDVYRTPELSAINNVPCSFVLGNHDVNQSSGADEKEVVISAASYVLPVKPKLQGLKRGVNEIAHTFHAETEEEILKKAEVFDHTNISYETLKTFPWIMPSDFYSQIYGKMQFFFLNSNNLLSDYLKLISDKVKDGYNVDDGELNQAAWLMDELHKAKAEGRECIFLQHHPYSVCGKRTAPDKYDTRQYLTQIEINELNNKLKELNKSHLPTESLNELIACMYRQMGVNETTVKKILCAHEHMIGLKDDDQPDPNKKLPPQLTMGSGGGAIEERKSWADKSLNVCEKDFGFAQISFDPDQPYYVNTDIYTLKGLHLHCETANGHHPIILSHSDKRVMQLNKCVLDACEEYFNRVLAKELESPAVKSAGVLSWTFGIAKNAASHYLSDAKSLNENNIAQHLQAYFKQYIQPDFKDSISYLAEQCDKLPALASLNSPVTFYSILNRALTENFGINWRNHPIAVENVYREPTSDRTPAATFSK